MEKYARHEYWHHPLSRFLCPKTWVEPDFFLRGGHMAKPCTLFWRNGPLGRAFYQLILHSILRFFTRTVRADPFRDPENFHEIPRIPPDSWDTHCQFFTKCVHCHLRNFFLSLPFVVRSFFIVDWYSDFPPDLHYRKYTPIPKHTFKNKQQWK